jgi:hypothetical protein
MNAVNIGTGYVIILVLSVTKSSHGHAGHYSKRWWRASGGHTDEGDVIVSILVCKYDVCVKLRRRWYSGCRMRKNEKEDDNE